MTAVLAANTTSPPKKGWLADTFASVWNWGADTLPGGNLTMLGIMLALGTMADQASKKKIGVTKTSGKGFWGGVITTFRTLWGSLVALAKAVRSVVRFYGGRELWGEHRSTATFWSAGTRIEKDDDQAVVLGSIAFAPPRISLIKQPRRAPSLWARKAAVWLKTYRGRGARWLDRTVRAVLWTARITGKVWKAGRATICTLRNWGCWPYAARGLARVIVTALVVFAVAPAWEVWALLVAALAAAALGALRAKLLPVAPGDDVVYGPKLWVLLREDLKLPNDEPRENWLQLPERLADEGARIVLRLPWTYRGS
ncbi:hypothetical protein ACIQGX_40885, partial [Streptomyces sp. NPDC092903]